MATLNVNTMTRKELLSVPSLADGEPAGVVDQIVIIPGNADDLHESGFRYMSLVLAREGEPIGRIPFAPDVLHLDGIGGLGRGGLSRDGLLMSKVPPAGWQIDCLPKSGLLNLRCLIADGITADHRFFSSFSVYAHWQGDDRDDFSYRQKHG